MLPDALIESIGLLLKKDGHPDETTAFVDAQNQPSARGLRANGLRIENRDTLNVLLTRFLNLPSRLDPVPWSSDGLYYPPDRSPASLAAYHAGLYYIQEPSAMLPAELLGSRPGERILDLCAAPGGKTCRIASDLDGEGLLWANDISASRIRPLIRNLELMGCVNAIVSEETPERLAIVMPGWFDRVLVDAPCSGAGMLRRDARALAGVGDSAPMPYVLEQAKILTAADLLLKPGGTLVYSTCTFAFEENEGQIADFLQDHPDYQPLPVPLGPGLSQGLPDANGRRIGIRIWPHRANGDGHFCAVLVKGSTSSEAVMPAARSGREIRGLLEQVPAGFQQFMAENLTQQGVERLGTKLSAILRLHEGHLHGLPMAGIPSDGLRLVKTGLYIGDLRPQGPFTPSHALSHVLRPADLQNVVYYDLDSIEASRYIRGETLFHPDQDSRPRAGAFVGIAGDGYLLGFARQMPDGHLKNLYPPAWRKHA